MNITDALWIYGLLACICGISFMLGRAYQELVELSKHNTIQRCIGCNGLVDGAPDGLQDARCNGCTEA